LKKRTNIRSFLFFLGEHDFNTKERREIFLIKETVLPFFC
jgi:hypothetical protein